MKKFDLVVKEYVRNLSNDDLHFLSSRFAQKCSGDWAEIAQILSKDKSIDKLLNNASSSSDWFKVVDTVGECVTKELAIRSDSMA